MGSLGSFVRGLFSRRFSVEGKQVGVEELLASLDPEAREAAGIGAVVRGLSRDPEHVARARTFFDGRSVLERAKVEIIAGDFEAAIAIYEEGGRFFIREAAECALKHVGRNRAIQVYLRALEGVEDPKFHEGLYFLYREEGDSASSQEHLRRAVEGRARQLYERAFDVLLDGDFKDEILFRDRELLVEVARKVDDIEKLLSAYEIASPFEAYELALQNGMVDRAMKIALEKVGRDFSQMAGVALRYGYVAEAVELFIRGGSELVAARVACQYGALEKALEICEPELRSFYRYEFHEIAMDVFSRLGNEEKRREIGSWARDGFARNGRFDVAALFAVKLGDEDGAGVYRSLAQLASS